MDINYNKKGWGTVKKIPLTHGLFATVDDEDFERLTQWKWRYGGQHSYAVRTQYYHDGTRGRGRTIQMHRVVMNASKGVMIDHINGDKLDNRKENLRFCNNGQNQSNSPSKRRSSSTYKGVNFHRNKWRATITVNKKGIHLGTYDSEEKAAMAYNAKAKEMFGEFAKINVINGVEIIDPSAIKINKKKSKYIGVSPSASKNGYWRAYVYVNRKQKHIGHFQSEELAAKAYNEVACTLGKKINAI